MSNRRVQCDIAVVGAGPAGIAAACVAAEAGRRVTVVEASPWLGGAIWRAAGAQPTSATARRWLARLQAAGATVLDRTTVVAAPTPQTWLAETPGGVCEVTAERFILAVGARELFLPLPGWTLPNVVGPGGLQLLVKTGWPVAGKRVVVAGTGPLLLAAAAQLRHAGAKVVLMAEQADWSRLLGFGLRLPVLAPGKLAQAAGYQWKLLGVPYRAGCWPVRVHGEQQVEGVTLRAGDKLRTVACDYLACAFGLVPNLELPELLGCRIKDGVVPVDDWQQTTVSGVYCAGEPTGVGGVDRALIEGQIAGYAASGQTPQAERLFAARSRTHRFSHALNQAFALRTEVRQLADADTVVCRCEDVTRGQLERYEGWRPAKLHTRCGMGPCQGRICGSATHVLFGWHPESVRPPVFPTSVGTLIEIGTEP